MMRPTMFLFVLSAAMLTGCSGGGGEGGGEPSARGGPTGNPERGAMVYETCAACHALSPDPDEIYFGPPLGGIVGRDVAADPEFAYSDAMRAYGGQWTEERLAAYLRAPEEAMPGTEMVQALPEPQDVLDVIAYLKAAQDESQREQ